MADVKVSALTALTGANLANGDELYVVDVGSPNVSKKITADELAQGSQFSSRFVPKSGETLWIGAAGMGATFGTPSLTWDGPTGWNISPLWLLDAANIELVGLTVFLPSYWGTYDVDLYWCNVDSTSGNVRWLLRYCNFGDGDQHDSLAGSFENIVAAPSTDGVVKVSRLNATAISRSTAEATGLAVGRLGNDAADTLANDCAVLGLLLTRAS
jgi:hypothetical protein